MQIADALSRSPALTTHRGDAARDLNVKVLLPDTRFKAEALIAPVGEVSLSVGTTDPLSLVTDLTSPRVEGDELAAVADPQLTDHTNWPVHVPGYLLTDTLPEGIPRAYHRCIVRQKLSFQILGRKLCRKVEVDGLEAAVPYLGKAERETKMSELHVVMGHLASPSILKSLKLRF